MTCAIVITIDLSIDTPAGTRHQREVSLPQRESDVRTAVPPMEEDGENIAVPRFFANTRTPKNCAVRMLVRGALVA